MNSHLHYASTRDLGRVCYTDLATSSINYQLGCITTISHSVDWLCQKDSIDSLSAKSGLPDFKQGRLSKMTLNINITSCIPIFYLYKIHYIVAISCNGTDVNRD